MISTGTHTSVALKLLAAKRTTDTYHRPPVAYAFSPLLPLVTGLADPSAIKVEQVWSRAAVAGHEGAIYLTIINAGPADSLIAKSTPVARQLNCTAPSTTMA